MEGAGFVDLAVGSFAYLLNPQIRANSPSKPPLYAQILHVVHVVYVVAGALFEGVGGWGWGRGLVEGGLVVGEGGGGGRGGGEGGGGSKMILILIVILIVALRACGRLAVAR